MNKLLDKLLRTKFLKRYRKRFYRFYEDKSFAFRYSRVYKAWRYRHNYWRLFKIVGFKSFGKVFDTSKLPPFDLEKHFKEGSWKDE